jgi:hypothetical protein
MKEQPKVEKSKIVDVDSLFALDAPSLDETSGAAPASSVFFDSVPPAGRSSRFRQLFAQDSSAPQSGPPSSNNHPIVDRGQSNPVFSSAPKSSTSVEDREGFQRIMAILSSGGGNKPNLSNVPLFLFDSNPSLWTNLLHCSGRHLPLCRMHQAKMRRRMNFFNVFFDKAKTCLLMGPLS